jgi:hypothetical protein
MEDHMHFCSYRRALLLKCAKDSDYFTFSIQALYSNYQPHCLVYTVVMEANETTSVRNAVALLHHKKSSGTDSQGLSKSRKRQICETDAVANAV